MGFEWKGIKRGLRVYGVKVWLKPKAEPDAYGDAGAYGDEVDEDFKQSENDEGANAHGVRFVEGGRGQLEVESSGAPSGVVTAAGADDVARFSLCEKSASGSDGGALVPKE